MKILVSTDSFKDSLSSVRVCIALKKGILKGCPEAHVELLPMADGGEGTVDALVKATGGEYRTIEVHDPLMRSVNATYGLLQDKSAVIEMAKASGIELLGNNERNPWKTTTYGVGELIKDALDQQCEKIIIGIGGSATNDGGAGMAMALGAKLLDKKNERIKLGGGNLCELQKIDVSDMDPRLKKVDISVACDVKNPLVGKKGASMVYGFQKGADNEMAKKLDANLHHLSIKWKEFMGIDIKDMEGAGAAGGLGAGLVAFLGAKLTPGFDLIRQFTGLEDRVKDADYIITGEGKIDEQTQYGKVPSGVAKLTSKYNKPLIAVAGTLGQGYSELYKQGFHLILSIVDKPMELQEALDNSEILIENTGETLGHFINKCHV